MNCIDAIEGMAKGIIDAYLRELIEERMDDSDYVRNVKVLINATSTYVQEHQVIFSNPKLLKNLLDTYAKELWLTQQRRSAAENDSAKDGQSAAERDEYNNFFYDHLYMNDTYPV
jgi:hypothetical protein